MSRFAAPDLLVTIAVCVVAATLAYVSMAHPRTEPEFAEEYR